MLEDLDIKLATEAQKIRDYITEAGNAITAIRSIKGGKTLQTLLPIGPGVMVKAVLSADDSLPVHVGAGVVLEKSADSAILFLESRIKEYNLSLNESASARQQVAAKMSKNVKLLEQMHEANSAN